MEFFNSAIEVLQTLVVALGAGLGVWGAANLLEGYGGDNPSAKSSDFKQYEKAIAVTDTYHETRTRFAWVGEIKDKRLQEGLEKLSDEELRLITLYFRDEYSTVELSKVYGIAQQNISKRILKITKFLKKFGFLGVD